MSKTCLSQESEGNNQLCFILHHVPFSQPRPRIIPRTSSMYDPSSKQKKCVRQEIINSLLYPVDYLYHFDFYEIEIIANYSVPKSYTKSKRSDYVRSRMPKANKPDIDNVAKFYLDCMSGLLFMDDNAVTKLTISKAYNSTDYVEICITGRMQQEVLEEIDRDHILNKETDNETEVKERFGLRFPPF